MKIRSILILVSFIFLGLMSSHCLSAGREPVPQKLRKLLISFEGTNSITLSYSDRKGFPYAHPRINAKINGVQGWFVIDTGTVMPLLSKQAVRRCGITVTASKDNLVNRGHMLRMQVATNVTVRLAPDFSIHWGTVDVLPTEDKRETNFFGFLDYGTMRAGHAVLDTKHKTITLSR